MYGISTIVARLLNFILTPILTRAFAPGIFGIFTNLYSWASLISPVLAFGMETTFFRYLHKEKDQQQVYGTTFLTVFFLALVFFSGAYTFAGAIAGFLHENSSIDDFKTYVRLFAGIITADALAVIPFARLRADGRPFKYSVLKLVNILVFLGVSLSFVWVIPYVIAVKGPGYAFLSGWYRENYIGYVFIANLMASLVTLLLLLPEIFTGRYTFSRSLALKMFSYSFPILVANLSFIVNENIDKILLPKLLPSGYSNDLGIYSACCKLAIFLSIFIQAFRLGAEPFFFSHAKASNSRQTYSQIMTWFVIAICVIFVGIVANIEILKLFIGGDTDAALYWSGLDVVPILLLGYVSLGIYMNLSIWYKLSDQTVYGLYISGIGAVLTLVLNFIFIPKYSYMAAAWVSLTAYATMMILSYVLGQKNYPIPYQLGKILAYLVSSIVVVVLSYYVFHSNLIIGNVLLIGYLLAIVRIEKNALQELWKKR